MKFHGHWRKNDMNALIFVCKTFGFFCQNLICSDGYARPLTDFSHVRQALHLESRGFLIFSFRVTFLSFVLNIPHLEFVFFTK